MAKTVPEPAILSVKFDIIIYNHSYKIANTTSQSVFMRLGLSSFSQYKTHCGKLSKYTMF